MTTATTTLDLAQWIPALAEEIHADKWSPNLDFTTHLECQQEAKRLGIQWGKTMEAKDVDAIRDAYRARWADRRKRSAKAAKLRGGK